MDSDINSLQFFPLNFKSPVIDGQTCHFSSSKNKTKKNEPSIFLREIHQETQSGQFVCKTTSFRLFFD